jgi:nicotinate-nucleotide pyrophosphorylase (carboxylating)
MPYGIPPLPDDLDATVSLALAEDIGSGDASACVIAAEAWAEATVVTREATLVAGGPWFDAVFRQLDRRVVVAWLVAEGDRVPAGSLLCRLSGPARSLLTGERTALNFLQTLSGTANAAHRYAEAVAGSPCRILDTRKTLPCLRTAQKYAVRVGGACNHRMGLHDAVMLKENHIEAAGGIAAALARVRAGGFGGPVIVEVETREELDQALACGVDHILLDNFRFEELPGIVRHVAGRARLEVSGGVGIADLARIAATGVDFISCGAITKHLAAVDLSMRIVRVE